MPKYLMEVSYAADGVKGLMKDGGSRRRAVADTLLQSLGGRIESFYYAFGETDVFVYLEGLIVYFDDTGQNAKLMLFTVPQPRDPADVPPRR